MNYPTANDQSSMFNISFRDVIISEDSYPEHFHDAYEIVFFMKADIEIFVKDMKYVIKDGDILFISKNEIHKLIYTMGSHYCRYVIHIKAGFIEKVLTALNLGEMLEELGNILVKHASPNFKEGNEIKGLFDGVYTLFQNSSRKLDVLLQAELNANLVLLLTGLSRILQNTKTQNKPGKSQGQVTAIIEYIDTHFMNSITLKQLEELFFLNKYYISHVFKNTTGFSVVEYIQLRRVVEAQKMLADGSRPSTEVCFECGFNNIQHFHRVFRKITGYTPERYRRGSVTKIW